eukprot:scaffold58638_cov63-Phaeocystis_antarctica.AAC.4
MEGDEPMAAMVGISIGRRESASGSMRAISRPKLATTLQRRRSEAFFHRTLSELIRYGRVPVALARKFGVFLVLSTRPPQRKSAGSVW